MLTNEIRCDYTTLSADPLSALSLADAKNYLKIDPGQTEDDDLIIQMIAAAAATFEAFTHQDLLIHIYRADCTAFPVSRLRRSFVNLCEFNCIEIRKSPLRELEFIKFFEKDTFVTWPDDEYEVVTGGDSAYSFIVAVKEWPRTECHPRPVQIFFNTGFGLNASEIPVPIRTGLEQHLAAMYENRGDCMCDRNTLRRGVFSMKSLPEVSRLLYSPFVIYAISNEFLC